MREIVEGVFIWSKPAEPQGYNFNGYFIRHPGGNLVIDPVEPDDEEMGFLVDEGVAEILITNRNHSRAANEVRSATGAQTAIHRADADYAQRQGCVVDEAMSTGDIHGPLVAIPAKGKSPGEMAFLWSERGILFIGDAAIGNPPGQLSLLPEEKLDDPVQLRDSLRGLLEVDFDTLLVGDGEPILTGAKAKLKELVESFVELEAKAASG